MKVLLLGGQGMLGHKVAQVLSSVFEVTTTFRAVGRWQHFPMFQNQTNVLVGINAHDLSTIEHAFKQVKPQVVINCIGIIKQLKEAKDPILSLEINALFPHRLAKMCRHYSSRLIHLSTDCVFSGHKGFYTEEDNPDPVDIYGRTKLLGEVAGENCLTLRTSIIGRDYVKNDGLIEWFLSNRGESVKGFTGAIYSGFTTLALAHIIKDLIIDFPELNGVYQLASPPINKFDLLEKIQLAADLDIVVEPYDDFTLDRSMNPEKFVAVSNYKLPTWDKMIPDLVAEFAHYDLWRKQYGIA